MYGWYTDTGKKKKVREGLLKWQGGREAKKQTKHKRRGPFGLRRFFSLFYTMVKLYNSGVFLGVFHCVD